MTSAAAPSGSIYSTFFNKLMQQSIEMGNQFMQPIFDIPNKNKKGDYYLSGVQTILSPKEKETDKDVYDRVEMTSKQTTILSRILTNEIIWNSTINNPRSVNSELKQLIYVPSIDLGHYNKKGDWLPNPVGYFPDESYTPNITINKTLAHYLLKKYEINKSGTSIENIPLFFIVRKPVEKTWNPKKYVTETSHLSVIVVCNGIMYSFGFGTTTDKLRYSPPKNKTYINTLAEKYLGDPFTVNDGVFLTPDANLFLHNKKTGTKFNFEIIDIGLFTLDHAEKILDMIKFKTDKIHDARKKTRWNMEISFETDKLDKTYVYPQVSFTVPSIEYKLCSKLSNATFNCTTYIEKIFKNRIKCIGYMTDYSKPTRCKRVSDALTEENLRFLKGLLIR